MADDVTIAIGAQDKASAVLNSVAGKIGSFSGAMSALGPVGLAVGAAIGGVALAYKSLSSAIEGVSAASARIDELYDKSLGLGASVGDLQAFQFAMQEAGNVDAGQSIQALQKLQKVIGEVATGGNDAAGAVLEKLGIDAAELSMQNPIDQFMQVKAAIGGIENISERASIAQKLLGRSAADLIPALISEQEAFEASMQAANDLGVTVSDQGAAGVAAMNDAVGRVSSGLSGIFNQVAVELAPVIEAIATEISTWIPPLISLAQQYLPPIIDATIQLAGLLTDISEVIASSLTLNFGNLVDMANRPSRNVAWLEQVNQARERAALAAQENAIKAEAATRAMIEGEEELTAKIDERGKAIAKAEEAAAKAYEDTIARLEREVAVGANGEAVVKQQEDVAKARTEQERFRIEQLYREIDLQKALADQEKDRLKTEQEKAKIAEREASDRDAEILRREKNKKSLAPDLQGTVSRLLTRGNTGAGPAELTARHTKQLVEHSKRAIAIAQKTYEEQQRKEAFAVEVVN